MKTKHPFIYIAGLMRTGSTLIQELLTEKRKCFFFHEPWFGSGLFEHMDLAHKILSEWEYNADVIVNNGIPIPNMFLRLASVCPQVGIKEIRHQGWEMYNNLFNDIRWIVLARDPRDIYVSSYHLMNRVDVWQPRFPPFGPEGMFKELWPDAQRQIEIIQTQKNVMRLRYEEFVSDTSLFERLRAHADSPLSEAGEVGAFHKLIKRGQYELETHNGSIGNIHVHRWKKETDFELISGMNEFFDMMKEYNNFWGY